MVKLHRNQNVIVLGRDGRLDPGFTTFHRSGMDTDGFECWEIAYLPVGVSVAERTDRSAAGRAGDFGGNPVESIPVLQEGDGYFHVDMPGIRGQRFCLAEEGDAGEQKLLDYDTRAKAAAAAGDTSNLGAGLPAPPDVSKGQQGGTPAPLLVGVVPEPEHPEIELGVVVGDQDAPPPADTPEETKAERKAQKRHLAVE